MWDFYSGTNPMLERPGSRDIEIETVIGWREPSEKTGKPVKHTLFAVGVRQQAKHGLATAPKIK